MIRTLSATLAMILAVIAAVPAAADEPAYAFKFSGFFKADAMYDNASIYPGNYRFWVNPYGDEKDNEFFLTANETRIGFDFAWKEETFTTSAKLEMDLFGLSAAENKSQLMLRQAYVQMKGDKWLVLAGQTGDIISPLVPKTTNYTVLWTQGNIGYRRPQIRGSVWTALSDGATLKLDAGVSRNISALDLDVDKLDDGTDTGYPTVQGRLGLDTKFGDGNSAAVGAWGHFGSSVYGPEDSLSVDSWSVGADLSVSIGPRVTLMGEFFMGECLGQYLGGVSQSVSPINEALPSMGGWGMISLKAADKVTLGLGYGFDDPDEAEWKVPDNETSYALRDLNSEAFGNLTYDITGNVQAMFEVAYCKTEYLSREYGEDDVTADYDAMRFQFAIKAGIK